jgi:hypothetical protein
VKNGNTMNDTQAMRDAKPITVPVGPCQKGCRYEGVCKTNEVACYQFWQFVQGKKRVLPSPHIIPTRNLYRAIFDSNHDEIGKGKHKYPDGCGTIEAMRLESVVGRDAEDPPPAKRGRGRPKLTFQEEWGWLK